MKSSKNLRLSEIILIIALLSIPLLVHNYSAIRTLVFAGIFAIAAEGLILLIGFAGQVSLGHAGFFAIGAYSTAILTTRFTISPWIAMLVGIVLTALVAYPVGLACLRLKGHYLVMATLGFGQMMSILLVEQDKLTQGVMGIAGIPNLNLFGLHISNDRAMYYLVWIIALLLFFFSNNISRYNPGRALHRIRSSEVQAEALGINVTQLKNNIFVVSAIVAALAGSLYAHFITAISPADFDVNASMNLLIMVVVGGRFSSWGAIVGSILVVGLPQLIRGYEAYSSGLFGILLIIVLLFLPGGLAEGLFSLFEKTQSLIIKFFSRIQIHKDRTK